MLEHVCLIMDNYPHVWPIPQAENKESYFRAVIEEGGEGIILKHLGSSYGINWTKMKKRGDVSVIITGYKPGNGKYANQVGALTLSVFLSNLYGINNIVEIGFASGMDDETRLDMTKNFNKYLNKVCDVFAQELTKDGRLRHPVFHRMRPDVAMNSCTLEKVKEDLSVKKVVAYTKSK